MSGQIQLKETKESEKGSSVEDVEAVDASDACQVQNKGWLKGMPPMAICCGVPVLLLAAISLFGISLAGVGGTLLNLAAVLACPLGMYLMMRMMMNKK